MPSSVLHLGTPGIGLYVQAGESSDKTGTNYGRAFGFNAAFTQQWKDGAHTLYENVIFNHAWVGQVGNSDVKDYVGVSPLVGYLYNKGIHSVGAEAEATIGTGSLIKGPETFGPDKTSVTATVLSYYTIGVKTWGIAGVALGGSYESNGGGWTGFLRIGVAVDLPNLFIGNTKGP